MQVVYLIAGLAAGTGAAALGWLLGAPAWALVVLYVGAGVLGVALAALAVHRAARPWHGRQGGRHAGGLP
jgi:hypothetical protein